MHYVLKEALGRNNVIPVLMIPELEMATPLAIALAAGGLTVFEITLRTPCALASMRLMKHAVPEALIGAGTVTTIDRLRQAKAYGADFVVSPGTTHSLWESSLTEEIPMLPGFSTASEAMNLLELGSAFGKFFPAEDSGGVDYLKSLNGPLPELKICPTGGIKPENAPNYLSCSNVICVGGSWIAPVELLYNGNYSEIESRARRAVTL
jgi:2-dehydro-3-deoxyphosphogluconate aldolase/(4S)-4-hydroxy-2-oxoglutarate aldolase